MGVLTNIVPTSGGTNTNDKPFNIFEYISRPTSNRQARKKVNTKKIKKMGKMDALKILMKIAGDHWERDLMMGSKAERGSSSTAGETVDFVCPSSEGHFPDPAQCDVYYQCAGGPLTGTPVTRVSSGTSTPTSATGRTAWTAASTHNSTRGPGHRQAG